MVLVTKPKLTEPGVPRRGALCILRVSVSSYARPSFFVWKDTLCRRSVGATPLAPVPFPSVGALQWPFHSCICAFIHSFIDTYYARGPGALA